MKSLAKVLGAGAIVAALTLGGCASVQKVTASPQSAADGCNAAAGVLSALADLKGAGKLTARQIASVDGVKPATDAFCSAHSAPVGTLAYAQFLANVGVLATMQLSASGGVNE